MTKCLQPKEFRHSSINEAAPIISYKPPTIPERFISGASPIHLSQRYLKWNNYGVIRSFSGDSGSSIEIEFHDTTIHPEIILDNGNTDYCIADLSDRAVALASIPDTKGEQSELLVIHIASWDTNSRRWTTKLPVKDCAVDVLASRTMIAVITEQRNVRVFTLSGTQRHIISHSGPILTSSCFESKIALCSVIGGDFYEEIGKKDPKPQYQHSVTIYDVDDKSWYRSSSNVSTLPLSLSRKERLVWLGYTNKGHLVTMDSGSLVRFLAPGGFWLPIFDGRKEVKGMSDALWPIGVIEGRQPQFRFLYCKGSKYPLIAVKMAPVIAAWSMPLCTPESDKSKLEESLFLNELQQSVSYEGSMPDTMELASSHLQTVIKLFALACKAERETRASELATMISSAKGIQIMCNYAAKLKKHTLVDKVATIGRENVALNECPPPQSSHVDQNVPRRLTLKRKVGISQNNSVIETEFDDDSSCGEDLTPATNDTLNETIESVGNNTLLPLHRMGRNPFKRSGLSTVDTSICVFDQMDLSFNNPRKRIKEGDNMKQIPKKKQIKLSFGVQSQQENENGRSTAYSLWLSNNEEYLRKSFSGEEENYPKYCAQQYRMIPASEKKEWKIRADSESV